MAEPTLGERLYVLARRDALAFHKLADDPEIHETVAVFHAQQAVEKALKAVLADAKAVHRRTHDIAELLDAIEDAGLAPPPHADRLDELNPYAVEYRYGLVDPAGIDRALIGVMLADLLQWVALRLRIGGQAAGSSVQ